ncbi:MAG: hypothetical protein P4L22_05410 [Candidatus Babeliales bacterium]|nr:hypothetical protein [Candidatus Babeliales bacterium]
MQINSKFLTLIIAFALTSTPKAESKITLNNVLTGINVMGSIGKIGLIKIDPQHKVYHAIDALVYLPTTYCLYTKTKFNKYAAFANGLLCLKSLYLAHKAHNLAKNSRNPYWIRDYSQNRNENIAEAFYNAFIAYHLNK